MENSKHENKKDAFLIKQYPQLSSGEKNKYYMGLDPCGYDGGLSSVCIIGTEDGKHFNPVVVYSSRNREEFEKEVERLLKFYKPKIST